MEVISQTGTTLATILGDVTTFVTSAISWLTSMCNAIIANPLIEAFVLVGLVGFSVGLLRRLIRV